MAVVAYKRRGDRLEEVVTKPEPAPKAGEKTGVNTKTTTEELLEEIDEILDEEERRSFKEKLRSLAFSGRARNPCENVVWGPSWLVDLGLATPYNGPPCEGC